MTTISRPDLERHLPWPDRHPLTGEPFTECTVEQGQPRTLLGEKRFTTASGATAWGEWRGEWCWTRTGGVVTKAIKVKCCDAEFCPFYAPDSRRSRNDRCGFGDGFYMDSCGLEGGFPTKCELRSGPVTVEIDETNEVWLAAKGADR